VTRYLRLLGMKNKNDHKRTALWPFLAVGAVIVAAILIWISFGPHRNLAVKVGRLWARQGVEKPNVILVTMDTTRADHLACYGYPNIKTPNLDALAGRGVLFEQAATAAPLTLPAHCTIMTGMYPTYHGVRVNGNTALSDEQTTVAEVLSARGYRTGAFIGAFVLDGRWGLKQGFQYYDDQFDLNKYKHLDLGAIQKPGNQVMDAALAWLEEQKKSSFFAWIHLYDPHLPYDPPEPYHSEYSLRGPTGLYDGEIAFMDEQIGRCVAWLEKNDLNKNTILVLIGDHGEGLGSHGEGAHGYFIYDYAVHVPFLVITPFPELRGKRVSSQVSSVDVFPTLLDLAHIAAPLKTQGRSLLPAMFRPEKEGEGTAYSESMAPNIQFGWSPLLSLRTARYKFIDAPQAELYDIHQDPDERTNIYSRDSAVAQKMKTELDRLITETSKDAPTPQAANLDKDTMERLSALGYIGAPVTMKKPSNDRSRPLADPKDKFPVFEAVTRAGGLIMTERYDAAVELLEPALRKDPTITQALLLLATCYVHLGRREEAKANLDLILREDPENIQGLTALADILVGEGKNEDAIALCKRTLSIDENNVEAYMLIGETYIGQDDHAQALPYLEKAVELQPKLTRNRFNLAASLVGVKQYDRAEILLKDIIRESPKFPRANYNLGLLYEEQGRLEEARAAYAGEVSAFPREFQARFNLGKVLLKLGDRTGYMDNMREVIKVAPEQAEGYLFLARGLFSEQVPLDEIQVLVEKGLSLARTSELKALGYFLLADIYNRKHESGKMSEALKKANAFKSKKE
jgi:arylsulfatase A-like enzyme/tetratricopeptide (TPR) repeat protein